MRKFLAALAVAGSALSAGPALAVVGADQVFVDPNTGIDGNPCTETSPCQTLARAMQVVGDPGTITVLSSGTHAPITITTGLTINCPRVSCIIDSSANANGGTGTTAVTVNAPGKTVHLSGVSISGFGTGTNGLSVLAVDKLELTGVSISGEAIGIAFTPGTASATSHMFMDDSTVKNATTRNIKIQPTSSNSASVVIRGSNIHHSTNGLLADATTGTGGVSVVVINSFIGYQSGAAVNALGNASGGAPSRVLIDSSALSFSSGTCIQSTNATAQVSLTKTQVTQCTTALAANGGGIFTYGDNAINFNTSNGSTPTTAGGFR